MLGQATLADIQTSFGVVTVELFPDVAPKTVENFIKLAESGFYNGTKFHRVIKNFMIQGGDPNSKDDDWTDDGRGGPGYSFEDEFNEHKVVRGALAMANSGPNTNGSQFFIVTAQATPWLDGKHTVFGRVVGEGMEVVDKIESMATNEKDHPLEDVVVERITITK
ncbi:MAG: peptidylprolyl isomerase [Candidatus Ryanbacteria bacterium RIFCSPHIGHO2_01_FULL_45_22]|uniref:Peptidyl-prolyl cis-trans isomerase n=2 Tax=Candidatus Ryaniibacteriota TaxID=1817914 RepID=A0A1G2FZR5_9BACT|nr:MAG: peptidylprolyl isomerase [Candidatus Ryanbacteria bacterium RIFCSPHIGHO2_01_FULL_45_22]OGZ45400.1 MAG: peptidylprolyl isomerase [Candidatus Ryanbacteria bacterium RIFCSPHIGHO2_02_FULL_45_13b]